MRRAVLVLVLALVVVASAAAAPAGPPRSLRVTTGGHSVRASLVHVCLRHGASTDCRASPVRLRQTLGVRPRAVLSLRFDRRATSVTVALSRGLTTVRPATRARGSGTRFRWTAPRSIGAADRLDVVAKFHRSDSQFAVRIKRAR
jgi:hypothetical protein